MEHKHPFSLLLIFVAFNLFSQTDNFGNLSEAEKNLKIYEKDSTASAVVLYEKGDNYFEVIDNRIRLIKDYHAKIKILDKKGFEHGSISIPVYKNESAEEKIKDIKAVTHLDGRQYQVLPSEIFANDISEFRSEQTFTFPKLKEGCILEYSYKMISPFLFNLNGWEFQSDIPKIYSEYNAKIPGNYVYNRTLIGSLALDKNEASIQKNCFYIDGYAQPADCEVLQYAMKDVPAFKSEEEFMLSEKNFISRIEFELSKHLRLDGITDKYTQSWEDVDKEFKGDKDIGRQLTKNGFFEKHVPEDLFSEPDPMKKAENIYKYVRNRYSWNGKYGVYGKARVKDAFEKRSGSASEINMALINLLNAADLKTNLMLISTRNAGLPKQVHPVMSDFNYCIARLEIGNKIFLLDATDKLMPFGMLPFRTLNHYGRVMDFKNESYWAPIVPEPKNTVQVRVSTQLDTENGKITGAMDIIADGYHALATNKKRNETTERNYLDELENTAVGDLEITQYKVNENWGDEKRVLERLQFEVETGLGGETIYINPFHMVFFKEHPFTLEERLYPIDFGYGRIYKYSWAMNVPEGYKMVDLPKKKHVVVGDNMLLLDFSTMDSAEQIGINFTLMIRESLIAAENYQELKDLFKEVMHIQNNSLVVLKKESIGPTGK